MKQYLDEHGGSRRVRLQAAAARFSIVAQADEPVAPDPYLVRSDPRVVPVSRRPRLRVVP